MLRPAALLADGQTAGRGAGRRAGRSHTSDPGALPRGTGLPAPAPAPCQWHFTLASLLALKSPCLPRLPKHASGLGVRVCGPSGQGIPTSTTQSGPRMLAGPDTHAARPPAETCRGACWWHGGFPPVTQHPPGRCPGPAPLGPGARLADCLSACARGLPSGRFFNPFARVPWACLLEELGGGAGGRLTISVFVCPPPGTLTARRRADAPRLEPARTNTDSSGHTLSGGPST